MSETADKLREIARLHDEAFDHAMQYDGHHKSSEGAITVHFTNRFDEGRDQEHHQHPHAQQRAAAPPVGKSVDAEALA